VKCPILILHSKMDEIVNYKCAEILQSSCMNVTPNLIEIKGSHNAPILTEDIINNIFN
jgi:poly(3-hydroxyalkanoate) synthetase